MSEQTPEPQPEQGEQQPQEVDASKVSIRAQQLASKHGVDLSNVTGTGHGGRVRYADVQKHVE
jgi:pyruvate/2-oxoglutarate dehydrogenase complex dihydrolipoamide acyltransferase (E2) component